MKTEKEFKEYINNLTEKELIELLKKHNLTYPIELSVIDKILEEVEPVELTEETKQMFLRTMRETAEKLWGKADINDIIKNEIDTYQKPKKMIRVEVFFDNGEIKYLEGEELREWEKILDSITLFRYAHGGKTGFEDIKWRIKKEAKCQK